MFPTDTWRNLPLPEQALAVAAILLAFAATCVVAWRGPVWCGRSHPGLPLPPGPWCPPVVGYLPFLDPRAPHRSLAELVARKAGSGGMIGVWLGSIYAVVVSDPHLVREALSREEFAGRAPLYLTHGIMKGHGIICAEGERWKTSRRFAASFLKTLGMVRFPGPRRDALERRIMVAAKECIQGFQEQMKGEAVGEGEGVELNPLPELLHGIGNLMSDLVFGKTWKRHDQTWKWLQSLQEEGTKLIGVAGPLNFLPFLRLIPYYKKTMDFLMEGKLKTHQLYRQFILEHLKSNDQLKENDSSKVIGIGLEENEEMDPSEETTINHKRGAPRDAIEAYVTHKTAGKEDRKYESYSEDNLQLADDTQFHHLLADLFGAGLDTSLATLRWLLLIVAVHPLVQNKIQEELDSVLGGTESVRRPVSMCDSASLPYLEATIAETQRIRPVVPLGIPHGALKDTTLGGFHIPRGSMIVPLQWALHNDECTWGAEAEKVFDPSRFLDENGSFNSRKYLSFMPFQSGRRVCVGEELAHMLLLLFGASILHEFRLSLAGDLATGDVLEGESGITLTPKPHRLVFRRRFPVSE